MRLSSSITLATPYMSLSLNRQHQLLVQTSPRSRRPLVYKLQKRLAAGEISTGTTVLSIGESDLLDLNGRAAIFSLKPIISDSGEIEQEPGSQNLHLAVRYLDGVLLSGLAQDYQFQELSFVRKPTGGADNSASRCVLHLGTRLVTFSGNV